MPLLPGQLESQRATALRDLTERCTVERYSLAQDDTGESSPTWAALALGVPCRVVDTATLRQSELIRLEAMGAVTQWLVVVPPTQDVTRKDQLRVTHGPSAGRLFEIEVVLAPHTDEVRRRCMCREVT